MKSESTARNLCQNNPAILPGDPAMWGLFDRNKRLIERYSEPVKPEIAGPYSHVLPRLDDRTRALMTNLPRGKSVLAGRMNREEDARWASPQETARLTVGQHDVGRTILLGMLNGQPIGYMDDKPMMTIASARTGKSSTVLIPNLLTYEGSVLVMDPKGELAAETAAHRRDVLGQDVYVLDAFGTSGHPSASYNVLADLDPDSPRIIADVEAIADSLTVSEGDKNVFWTESARGLIGGLILLVLVDDRFEKNLVTVRQLLTLSHPLQLELAEHPKIRDARDPAGILRNLLFEWMVSKPRAFDGILAGIGNDFLGAAPETRANIIKSTETQTRFLNELGMRAISRTSSFSLTDLRDRNITVYLCLPGTDMHTLFRWPRVIIQQALRLLERKGPWPRKKTPILLLCEELPILQNMPILEKAIAYFPGFGVKFWGVIQDLPQLIRYYPDAWKTFMGNAGLIQAFANNDRDTLDYLSEWLGETTMIRARTDVSADGMNSRIRTALLSPQDIRRIFARYHDDQGRMLGHQLLLIPGQYPHAVTRLSHEEVENLRINHERGILSIAPPAAALPAPGPAFPSIWKNQKAAIR